MNSSFSTITKHFTQAGLTSISEEEAIAVNGGSEFSETVFFYFGKIARFFVEAAKDAHRNPIRPSQYR